MSVKTFDESGLVANVEDLSDGVKGFGALNPDIETNEVRHINESREKRLAELHQKHPALYIARQLYIQREDQ